MIIEDYLKSIGITKEGTPNEENAYIIDLYSSDEFGKIFSKLEKIDDVEELEDNQVITEQGSSLMYQSKTEPYIINLIADWDSGIYQLIVTEIE